MAIDPSSPSSPSPRQNPPSQAGSPSASSPSGPAAPSDPPPSPSRPPIPPVPPPPSNPGATGADTDADRLAASSPSTPAAELARIAAARPDLHPALAANPTVYPDLVDWLRTSPDPAVQAALAQRTTAQPEPTETTPAQAEALTRTADATANPSTSTAPAPAAKTKRRAGLTRSTASAGSGADADSTASPAPRTRRRPRMGIIAAILVAVLALAGGAAIAVKKLHGGTGAQATSPASGWAGEWRQIWKLDAVASGYHRDILGNENQFVVIDTDDSSSQAVDTVTSYDVSGDTLEKQWEITVNRTRNDYSGSPRYWGNYIVDRTWLIDSRTGEYIPCPWQVQEYPEEFIDNYAVYCSTGDQCSAWRSDAPDHKLWTKNIPGTNDFLLTNRSFDSVYQGDQTIARLANGALVDLATGEAYNIDTNSFSGANHPVEIDPATGETYEVETPETTGIVTALTDGWAFSRDGNIILASPSGQEKEIIGAVNRKDNDKLFLATARQPHASTEQYKSYLIDGDVSWAEVAIMSVTPNKCDGKLTVAGVTANTFGDKCDWDADESFPWSGNKIAVVSDDQSLLIREQDDTALRTNTGAYIDAMWNIQNSRRINLSKQYDHFYMVNPNLIVAQVDDTGELVAYRPAGK